MIESDEQRSRLGVACGITAYGFWGLIPLYFKLVADVAPTEVLAHRAAWSFVALSVMVLAWGRWRDVWREMRKPKMLAMLSASTLLIAVNWLLFIYAVQTKQVVQSSLGYFINPLVNVLLGVVFLRERLRPGQILSICLAATGVIILASLAGEAPWIAFALALSFAGYALLRKIIPVDALVGLTVETMLLTPIALGYLAFLGVREEMTAADFTMGAMLALSGPVTTIPLLFFGAATKRLRLSTLGILQYLTPTLQFLLAVLAFGEPFSNAQLASFSLIWTAIAIYTVDALRSPQRMPIEVLEPD